MKTSRLALPLALGAAGLLVIASCSSFGESPADTSSGSTSTSSGSTTSSSSGGTANDSSVTAIDASELEPGTCRNEILTETFDGALSTDWATLESQGLHQLRVEQTPGGGGGAHLLVAAGTEGTGIDFPAAISREFPGKVNGARVTFRVLAQEIAKYVEFGCSVVLYRDLAPELDARVYLRFDDKLGAEATVNRNGDNLPPNAVDLPSLPLNAWQDIAIEMVVDPTTHDVTQKVWVGIDRVATLPTFNAGEGDISRIELLCGIFWFDPDGPQEVTMSIDDVKLYTCP